jgi:hypothetical protein
MVYQQQSPMQEMMYFRQNPQQLPVQPQYQQYITTPQQISVIQLPQNQVVQPNATNYGNGNLTVPQPFASPTAPNRVDVSGQGLSSSVAFTNQTVLATPANNLYAPPTMTEPGSYCICAQSHFCNRWSQPLNFTIVIELAEITNN